MFSPVPSLPHFIPPRPRPLLATLNSLGTILPTGTEETESSTKMLSSLLKACSPARSGGASDGTHGAVHPADVQAPLPPGTQRETS